MSKFDFPNIDEIERGTLHSQNNRNKKLNAYIEGTNQEHKEFKALPVELLSNIDNQLEKQRNEINTLKNDLKEMDKQNNKSSWKIACFGVIASVIVTFLFNLFLEYINF